MKRLWVLVLLFLPLVSSYEFCEYGEVGENLTIVSIEDEKLDNSEDWVWDWGDEVEVVVNLESGFNETEDFVAELIFRDKGDGHAYLAIDEANLEKNFEIDAEDEVSVSFVFEVDEEVLEAEYDMYVKFYKDNDEDKECVEVAQVIRVGSLVLCEDGEVDASDLEITSVSDENLDNSEDWVWSSGDEVNVSVNVNNDGFDILALDVELVFVNEGGDIVNFVNDVSSLAVGLDLDENEEDVVSFVFEVGDLDEGNYELYVVVIDNNNSTICSSFRASEGIEVVSDAGVIVSSVSGSQSIVAGSSVNYSVVVENFESSVEEQVVVYAYSFVLGVSEEFVIYDLGVGEKQTISLVIDYPKNISGDSGVIVFSAEYDYDSDKDVYLSSYNANTYSKKLFVSIVSDGSESEVEENNGSLETEEDVLDLENGVFEDGVEDSSELEDFDGGLKYWVIGGLILLWVVLIVVSYFVFN
jgi:hypothetical protein